MESSKFYDMRCNIGASNFKILVFRRHVFIFLLPGSEDAHKQNWDNDNMVYVGRTNVLVVANTVRSGSASPISMVFVHPQCFLSIKENWQLWMCINLWIPNYTSLAADHICTCPYIYCFIVFDQIGFCLTSISLPVNMFICLYHNCYGNYLLAPRLSLMADAGGDSR